MNIEEKIAMNKRNIRKAIEDYGAYSYRTSVLEDVSDKFVERLARDNAYAKQELRELFRKSPVWNEELDCLVINGTRTHNSDLKRVGKLANDILYQARWNTHYEQGEKIDCAISFFTHPDADHTLAIEALNELAPKAYAPRKKRSRIFRALCESLGVANDEAGSGFQKLYAQFADELSSKKIDFKLFVSLNPAHFLTMSNPKEDKRGDTLTSCHSFNSTDYQYNNGCSGYARDEYTFIAFIAADPMNPETLNNRKTMRQIFAYRPGNGVLLQSRLYNTSGGTYGAQKDSKLYRDLVQREISDLEGAANLWQTFNYYGNKHLNIDIGQGFGGYPDWTYKDFDAKLSIRNDHAGDYGSFKIGTYGLCICCGCEIDSKLYCYDCSPGDEDDDDSCTCDHCEEDCDETYPVYNSAGSLIYVCEDCRENYYDYCSECEEYHPKDEMIRLPDSTRICRRCSENHYDVCEDCGEHYRTDTIIDGLCEYCRERCEEGCAAA